MLQNVCPFLLIEAHCPAELTSNTPVCKFLVIPKTFTVQVCLIRAIDKLCWKVALQEQD